MPQVFGLGGAVFGRKHRLQCLELSMAPEACSELMQHYIDPVLLDKIDFTCSHPPMPRYLTYVDHKRHYGERFPASIHTPLHPLESLCQQPTHDVGLRHLRHPPTVPATLRESVKYEIRLESFLSYGSLWDAYTATLVGPSTSSVELVVKVTAPIHYPRSQRDKCSEIRFTSAEARQAALHEVAMYEGPLEPLQGTHVPRFYGLWSGRYPRGDPEAGQEIMVMLLENAGMPILDVAADPDVGLWDLSMEQGREVFDLVKTILDHGVSHHDIVIRHIFRHPQGGLRLIDFEDSTLLHDQGWGRIVMEEKIEWLQELLLRSRIAR